MKEHVIIVSGWAVNPFVWREFEQLLSNNYQVTIIDFNNTYIEESFNNKVKSIIKSKKIDRFILIGWSLGSMVALDIANYYSNRINYLILFSATSKFAVTKNEDYQYGWNTIIVKRMINQLKIDTKTILNQFYKNMFCKAELKEGFLDNFLQKENKHRTYNVDSLIKGLEYLMISDIRKKLSTINIPVLFIHGKNDNICPIEAGYYINKLLIKSEFISIQNTGHAPFFSKAEYCYNSIINYIT